MLWTLLPYLTAAGNLVLVLGVVLAVSQSVRGLRKRVKAQEAALRAEIDQAAAAIQELKGKIQQLDEKQLTHPSGASGASLNGNLRGRVLKMHRLGQASGRIAEALRVPKGEVDLLVKVHQIVMQPFEEAGAPVAEKH